MFVPKFYVSPISEKLSRVARVSRQLTDGVQRTRPPNYIAECSPVARNRARKTLCIDFIFCVRLHFFGGSIFFASEEQDPDSKRDRRGTSAADEYTSNSATR